MIDQYGALVWRIEPEKGLEILLITSRDTGRWVIPRGNPMPGLEGHETAAREAWEEAGVEGRIGTEPLGRYRYDKRRGGESVPAEVNVYPMRVGKQNREWPERGERTIRWFDPASAARAVEEEELAALILGFEPDDAV